MRICDTLVCCRITHQQADTYPHGSPRWCCCFLQQMKTQLAFRAVLTNIFELFAIKIPFPPILPPAETSGLLDLMHCWPVVVYFYGHLAVAQVFDNFELVSGGLCMIFMSNEIFSWFNTTGVWGNTHKRWKAIRRALVWMQWRHERVWGTLARGTAFEALLSVISCCKKMKQANCFYGWNTPLGLVPKRHRDSRAAVDAVGCAWLSACVRTVWLVSLKIQQMFFSE